MNLSSHSLVTKTKPIQFSTMKHIESQQQTEENREGKINSLCAPCVSLKSTESEPLVSWGTPWDPSQWWQSIYVGEKDDDTNRQTKFPRSEPKTVNIGKVVSTPENVSKTEMTNNKDKSLSITASKSHDGIDLDPLASNNKVVSSVPEERKLPLYGDTNEALG